MLPGQKSIPLLFLIGALAFSFSLSGANFQRIYDLALDRHGQDAADVVSQWQAMIVKSGTIPDAEKLVLVNDFFNMRIRFVDDLISWGEKDYWATPLQTIGRRQGDCEDFSIAKYVTLLLAGVDIDKLRITYVKADMGERAGNGTQAHMVLAYYASPASEPLVLDNLVADILPASQRSDLIPVYGFNGKGLWVGASGKPASNNPGASLSRWRDLLQRMEQDGIQ